MAGNYIAPAREMPRTIGFKSVFAAFSNYTLFAIIPILACAGGSQFDRNSNTSLQRQILNLRATVTSGPSLGKGITLIEPADLVVNSLGEIYITDKGSNSIIKLSRDFQVLASEGGIGSGLGDLNRPAGIDYDAAMNIVSYRLSGEE